MKKIKLFSIGKAKNIEGSYAELYCNFYIVFNREYIFTFLIESPDLACSNRHPIRLIKHWIMEIEEQETKYLRRYEKFIKNDLAVEEFAERVLKAMDFAIKATDSKDNYSIGMRNGIRYSKSLIDSKEPNFEHIENDNCGKGCDFCKHTSECMPSKE